MTSAQLRRRLTHWHITPYRFARITGVEPSTVGRWLDGTSEVPGYAACIVALIDLLPEHDREETLFPSEPIPHYRELRGIFGRPDK